MCGIALIVSGVRIIVPDHLYLNPTASTEEEVRITSSDLKASLLRRGPDNQGSKKIFLKESVNVESVGTLEIEHSAAELEFIGATLQLRGVTPVFQPLVDDSGNILIYNGELFGGITVADYENDSKALLAALGTCCSCGCLGFEKACSCVGNGEKAVQSIPEILSTVRGPWALIYWQEKSKTVWFGRDAFGRRSLLVHWPVVGDFRFVLSSVSPASSCISNAGFRSKTGDFEHMAEPGVTDMACSPFYWEELPCGIYSIQIQASDSSEQFMKEKFVGQIKKHAWTDSLLKKLIKWERTFLDPKMEELSSNGHPLPIELPSLPSIFSKGMHDNIGEQQYFLMKQTTLHSGHTHPAQKVLVALRESVMRRTAINSIFQTSGDHSIENVLVPIAVLFSGGLDSMILAALLNQCLDSGYSIDLLNVSFDGQLAPDRISARLGVKELQSIAPLRRWRLVEIDADLSNLTWETKHVMSLIHPSKTYMDLNIGIALWLAAEGDGWVDGEICYHPQEDRCRYKYKSSARVLLVGSGADEQCAGYGRHRTKYRQGGWIALQEEMRLDMQRIWKRNLGRDDRCISDHGKEARFPFLDEDVIKTLLEIPLWEITDLDEPVGRGDKKILREVAKLLGLEGAALLPKRAIQFGSRIARESNRKNFGSNRAANQASAGSVDICLHAMENC